MITTFKCLTAGCPNEGIDYNMEDSPESVMCGGCKAILLPSK